MQLYTFLCDELSISKQKISQFALSAPKKYKIYKIPKRTSGHRVIAHPSKQLKAYQRLLTTKLEETLPLHNSAVAYRKGLGIKNNAQIHKETRYLLKMDFKDFFPSITPSLFFEYLSKLEVSVNKEDRYLLTQLLFFNISKKDGGSLRLSIGAPSSPFISNTILYFFDKKLFELCKKKGIRYSRYADDLTFSTNVKGGLFETPKIVRNILKETVGDHISINKAKTVFSSKAHNRHVTGVTITNDNKLSIGRERKRLISTLIHKRTIKTLPIEDFSYLQGLLSFASDIEPDFIRRMGTKYSAQTIDEIMTGKYE